MLCISDFSTTTVATLPSSSKNRCPRGYNNGERVLSLFEDNRDESFGSI